MDKLDTAFYFVFEEEIPQQATEAMYDLYTNQRAAWDALVAAKRIEAIIGEYDGEAWYRSGAAAIDRANLPAYFGEVGIEALEKRCAYRNGFYAGAMAIDEMMRQAARE